MFTTQPPRELLVRPIIMPPEDLPWQDAGDRRAAVTLNTRWASVSRGWSEAVDPESLKLLIGMPTWRERWQAFHGAFQVHTARGWVTWAPAL